VRVGPNPNSEPNPNPNSEPNPNQFVVRVGPTGHQFWSLLTPWNHRPLRFHPYAPQRTLTRTLAPTLTLTLSLSPTLTPANPIPSLHLPRYVPRFAVHFTSPISPIYLPFISPCTCPASQCPLPPLFLPYISLHLPRYVPLFAVHGYVEASWAVGGSAPDAIGAG